MLTGHYVFGSILQPRAKWALTRHLFVPIYSHTVPALLHCKNNSPFFNFVADMMTIETETCGVRSTDSGIKYLFVREVVLNKIDKIIYHCRQKLNTIVFWPALNNISLDRFQNYSFRSISHFGHYPGHFGEFSGLISTQLLIV